MIVLVDGLLFYYYQYWMGRIGVKEKNPLVCDIGPVRRQIQSRFRERNEDSLHCFN